MPVREQAFSQVRHSDDEAEFARKVQLLIYGPSEAVFHQDDDGYEETTFRLLEPGAIFWDMTVLTGEKRSASIFSKEEAHVLSFGLDGLRI